MPKFLKKVNFLKKNASENLYGFINCQIFFALKAAFIEYMIRCEFEKNCLNCFRMNFWIRVPENVKIFILHKFAQVGDSRFEFSTKFRFSRCSKILPTFSYQSDFNTLKYVNLPSKSGSIAFWDIDPKL